MAAADPTKISVSPEPTDDELAAIVAAYRELWPEPSEATAPAPVSTRWKFSGRWWANTPARRGRR